VKRKYQEDEKEDRMEEEDFQRERSDDFLWPELCPKQDACRMNNGLCAVN
jgi:hypothetical protein